MIKCDNCEHTIEEVNTPMVCPKCGHIMKPYVEKEIENENGEVVTEEKQLNLFED